MSFHNVQDLKGVPEKQAYMAYKSRLNITDEVYCLKIKLLFTVYSLIYSIVYSIDYSIFYSIYKF